MNQNLQEVATFELGSGTMPTIESQQRTGLTPAEQCALLLPTLYGKRGCEFSLVSLVLAAEASEADFDRRNALHIQRILKETEQQQAADFSFGGWMENRREVFRGTYMDVDARYVHLGVDINVPAGAVVRFPCAAKVLHVSTSTDIEVGWGTRIDFKHPSLPLVFLIGHLAPDVTVRVGEQIPTQGAILGRVGGPEVNGNVDPHIHIQVMELSRYQRLLEQDDLDGYGSEPQANALRELYPEPLEVLSEVFCADAPSKLRPCYELKDDTGKLLCGSTHREILEQLRLSSAWTCHETLEEYLAGVADVFGLPAGERSAERVCAALLKFGILSEVRR